MNAPYQKATPEELIIWDVIEEHFDEAAFLIATWQEALIAPNYTLDEVADRVEDRLEANLKGLEIGGNAVAERLLYPALTEASDPGYATAAAMVLLRNDNAQGRKAVLDALVATEGEHREGVALALCVSKTTSIDHDLKQRFDSTRDEEQCTIWLSILNRRRIHPGTHLKQCLASKNDALLAEAIISLGLNYASNSSSKYALFIQKHLNNASVEVQAAALEAGLLIGMPEAWQRCLALANTPNPNRIRCLERVALLASRGEFQLLFPLLEDSKIQETALWCLGLTGSVASVERALDYLDNDDPRLAKLAFEAISHITGLDMEENRFQLDEEPDDDEAFLTGLDDEEIVLDPIEGLMLPNAAEVAKWWDEHRSEFSHAKRYVRGEPLTVQTLVKTLETGPMRLRNPFAKFLWIRTGGQRHLSTHTFSKQQYQELEQLASLQDGELFNYL